MPGELLIAQAMARFMDAAVVDGRGWAGDGRPSGRLRLRVGDTLANRQLLEPANPPPP